MDEKPVTADVVVACLFAGVGAWGAKVTVSNGGTIYASELFGPGHGSPMYPTGKAPMAVLTITANEAAEGDNPAVDHSGSVEVTFSLTHGATFNANVSGLVWDSNTGEDGTDGDGDMANDYVAAPGTVASIKSGGRKGNSSITITLEAAADGVGDTANRGDANEIAIGFELPQLANLGALGVANSLDANPLNDQPAIYMQASVTRLVSGAFTANTNLPLTGSPPGYAVPVIHSRDSVTVTADASTGGMKTIVIDGDSAFKAVKEAKNGYVNLATVKITTKPLDPRTAVEMEPGGVVGYIKEPNEEGQDTARDEVVYSPGRADVAAKPYDIRGMDGLVVDAGLRGTLTMSATGTRELFNEDDMLFIDYDKNGKMGPGEEIMIDADMMNVAMGSALSIDADNAQSDSFDKGGVGEFTVYYMPGGKGTINHRATINLVASVDYSDPSANDEDDAKASNTLNFDGVAGNGIKAYAIPHSTNQIGDKGNLRVRCEDSTDCRVFLECWGDGGTETRAFGEVDGGVPANGVMVWNGAAIESVTGRMPDSRHSCRVLSKGMVTVQQLTRDGNSQTLVNNTFVGEE